MTELKKNYLFLLLGVLFFLLPTNMQSSNMEPPLPEFIKTFNANHIELEKWTVYYREPLSEGYEIKDNFASDANSNYLMEIYKELDLPNDQFSWEISSSSDKWTAVGTSSQTEFQEKITFIAYPHNQQNKTYLIYEIERKQWNDGNWNQINKHIQKQVLEIFSNEPKSFACIEGNYSDNIEGVLYDRAANMLKEFSADPIEALKEETFVSVSAYTDKWKQYIPTQEGKINIQVALRTSSEIGGKTTVTIGTPIITAEY